MADKVVMTLAGLDGNAFNLLGAFQREALRQGWTQDEVREVFRKARSGDYDHLVRTLLEHTEEGEEYEAGELD